MTMVLVDGEVGPTKLDLQMLDWMRSHGLPHTVIATKHDKVKSAKRAKRKKELAEACLLEQGDVVWVSAAKNVNIDRLRELVERIVVGVSARQGHRDGLLHVLQVSLGLLDVLRALHDRAAVLSGHREPRDDVDPVVSARARRGSLPR